MSTAEEIAKLADAIDRATAVPQELMIGPDHPLHEAAMKFHMRGKADPVADNEPRGRNGKRVSEQTTEEWLADYEAALKEQGKL